jgi:uncharacterized protein (DUF924 family)
MAKTINAILDFWFGELDDRGLSPPEQHALWFKSSADTDQYCSAQFGDRVTLAVAGELDHWAESDRGLIALVLLLDQFTRNIYRDTPLAFSGDPGALALARHTIATGRHRHLPAIHQVFLYLPLEHAEDLAVQEQSVELFAKLAAVTRQEMLAGFSRYAVSHRDVIAQFGRFPHRNAILERESTKAELKYLDTHGGF